MPFNTERLRKSIAKFGTVFLFHWVFKLIMGSPEMRENMNISFS